MKIRVEMPADQYDLLLRASERGSPEFRILIAACIEERANGKQLERVAEILCNMDEVKQIFELANRISLDAAKAIVKSLRLSQAK
jgi:hypothetical protein